MDQGHAVGGRLYRWVALDQGTPVLVGGVVHVEMMLLVVRTIYVHLSMTLYGVLCLPSSG